MRSTMYLDIVYSTDESKAMLEYSDSDYTSDKQDRKSILGHIYMLGGGSVLWTSQKQKSVVTSTWNLARTGIERYGHGQVPWS